MSARDPLAEVLCRADDTQHHHEATDDFPCWHCKEKADVVRAFLASDERPEGEAVEVRPHDRRGDLDRSLCGECGGAFIECVRCTVFVCECPSDCKPEADR